MIDSIIQTIQTLVTTYGAFGIFLGALIEEVISVIPSAAVIMFSGFFVMGGLPIDTTSVYKLLISVSLPVALGLTLGSLLIYSLAYYFGAPFINRFGKYFGVSPHYFYRRIHKRNYCGLRWLATGKLVS